VGAGQHRRRRHAGRRGRPVDPPQADHDRRRHGDEDRPAYRKISERFRNDPAYFEEVFARAWFKLTHRDMGPKARYIGPDVPKEDLIWQDPVPAGRTDYDVAAVKAKIAASGLSSSATWSPPPGTAPAPSAARTSAAAPTARASAWPRRRTGKATSRPAWPGCWRCYEKIAAETGASVADVIVLGGNVGVEQAIKAAGFDVDVPFAPGRGDATPGADRRRILRGAGAGADGFRNWLKKDYVVSPRRCCSTAPS
jgi:catalase-peroxidase